ncbi:membrane protein insertion efficiency factor YidD [bacterium]|nr:MAG: membrane protein insertion efficiency factor YidD [bacterium]
MFTQLVRFYQKHISILLAPSCRFHPSCSHYFQGAIAKYGILRGGFKGFFRIIRCNPFCHGGYDPV